MASASVAFIDAWNNTFLHLKAHLDHVPVAWEVWKRLFWLRGCFRSHASSGCSPVLLQIAVLGAISENRLVKGAWPVAPGPLEKGRQSHCAALGRGRSRTPGIPRSRAPPVPVCCQRRDES
jgi:hypothetical protein